MLLARSFLLLSTSDGSASLKTSPASFSMPAGAQRFVSSDSNAVLIVWDVVGGAATPADGSIRVLVGDDMERDEADMRVPLGAAAQLALDLTSAEARIVPSVTALPPVFVDRRVAAGASAIASSIDALQLVRDQPLSLDSQSVVDLFHTGFPLAWRTLFRGVTIAPSSTPFAMAKGKIHSDSVFSPFAGHAGPEGLGSRVQQQVALFRDAAAAMDVQNSVLSLSGGLDTRAIFSELVARTTVVPAVTMTGGGNLGLDARMAAALCKHYGVRHEVVALGDDFVSRLPDYVRAASRLSGGLASLSQAHEVYMAERIAQLGARRVSGNLGNQVGRQGVEGVSIRNADLSLLAPDVQKQALVSARHWIEEAVSEVGGRFFEALITREVPFSSVGNYSIGRSFSVQQSPYASRRLIAFSAARAPAASFEPAEARKRDLRHRFFGPPIEASFQRQAIIARGGYASHYPINWGWRAIGGISPLGALKGGAALLDALSGRLRLPGRLMEAARIGGLHETRPLDRWIDRHLAGFIQDTLGTVAVAQSGWFDTPRLRSTITRHFNGSDRQPGAIIAALDLALAIDTFTKASAPRPAR